MSSSTPDAEVETTDEVAALATILSAFKAAAPEARHRIFRTLRAFFESEERESKRPISAAPPTPIPRSPFASFPISVQQFIFERQPKGDTERVVCLAYYLTHCFHKRRFETIDITKLNGDAGQDKFSNAAKVVAVATKAGFLVLVAPGERRISALGASFVEALPDRARAREISERLRRTTRPKARRSKTSTEVDRTR